MIEVFISYSHEDRDHIDPVVDLLRATMGDAVFQDYRSIKPGKKWRDKLLEALDQAKKVLVFWCHHSSTSDYVREEYEYAIRADKDVMPLLMDDTAVPPPLDAYQWIDLRRLRLHGIPDEPPRVKFCLTEKPLSRRSRGEEESWDSEKWEEQLDRKRRAETVLRHNRLNAALIISEEIKKRWMEEGG